MWGVLAAGLIFVTQTKAASVESILAEAYGFETVTPDAWQLRYGTYWFVSWGTLVPMPGVPSVPYSQIFSIGEASDMSFLVDQNTSASGVNFTRLAVDLDWLLGALAQAQEAKLNAELSAMLGLTSEMDSESEGESSPQYGPDDLWLSINVDTNSSAH